MSARARQNGHLARRIWESASAGDPSSVLAFSPDIEWRTYGSGPHAGEFHGLDEVLRYLARTGQAAEHMRADLIDVYSSDRGAVLHHRSRFERGLDSYEADFFLHFEIEDGVVARVVSVPWEQARGADFWKVH